MAKPARGETKKPYSKPMLLVFGSVQDLTQRVGPRGKKDGGSVTGSKHSHA